MHPLLAEINTERIGADKEYTEELRHRAQTDHFFLAPLLGYFDFRPDLHGPVRDLYVQKRPGVAIEDQHPIKNRMHLDPRHTFKSTFGHVDTIQWVLNFPHVTICNETATKSLAKLLTSRQGRVFLRPKTKPPSILQSLFPEMCVGVLKGDYRCPASKVDTVEPTIYSTSPGSSQSGYHPWILNPDDMADTENSGIDATDASRDKVWNSYTTNLNTLRLGGYQNIRGTRYHPLDMYGRILKNINPKTWKTLIRPSVRVRSGARLIEGEFPAESELEMLWPGLLDYEFLKDKFKEYISFMCQQQNDPAGGGVQLFSPARIAQADMDPENMPQLGQVRVCWRLPCDAKPYMARYAVGAAVMDYGGRLYVIDAWRGVYTPSELYERVVSSCKRHNSGELIIERTPGSEYVLPHIRNEAAHRNWSLQIQQPEFESDDTARKGRCEQIEPLMRAGRLWFSTRMGQREECHAQFVNFGVTEECGFPDVISRIATRMPLSILAGNISDSQREMREKAQKREQWESVYSHGGAAAVEDAVLARLRAQGTARNSYGLTPMLGGLDG